MFLNFYIFNWFIVQFLVQNITNSFVFTLNSFLIGGDGQIYEGRGWANQPLVPARFKAVNKKVIVIGFIGRYKRKYIKIAFLRTFCDFQ